MEDVKKGGRSISEHRSRMQWGAEGQLTFCDIWRPREDEEATFLSFFCCSYLKCLLISGLNVIWELLSPGAMTFAA